MVPTGLKLQNQNEVDGLFFEEPTPFGAWEQQFGDGGGFNLGLPGLIEFEPFWLAHQMSMTSQVKLNDFEEISSELGLWDMDQPSFHNEANIFDSNSITDMHNNHIIDQNKDVVSSRMHDSSLMMTLTHQGEFSSLSKNVIVINNQNEDFVGTRKYGSSPTMTLTHPREVSSLNGNLDARKSGKYKSSSLQLVEIQKYFDVPITTAAKELNVGLTVLKKRCRELNIMRWPHRKIKSLKSLIHNVKELGLTNEIEMLEEHKRMVEKIPEMELTERAKKLRQACFKANYKKRRALQAALA